ncbi:meiosis inhibitor protein 1 [Caerostris darwini]|uniref:Meiosis inhibitor protein 1 n=1 Tax=Caerostris darwini TaxID=1538125 RepID=A0AAV4PU68_9ARAC|nr:meiosis inhibitor protein 1 [Caerostris darwini]
MPNIEGGELAKTTKRGRELLFEAISGKNELLTETIVCCLLMFMHSSFFFEKCHVLYGMNIILDVASDLLNQKNWKLLCLTFDLLISLTSSEKYSLAAATQYSLFEQALTLIEKSYKVHGPQVLLAVNKFFNQFLKKECLPFTIPSSKLFAILHMSMKRLLQFFSSHSHVPGKAMNDHENNNIENLPLEVKLMISGMNILCSFIRVTKLCPSKTKERLLCELTENGDKSAYFLTNSNFEVIQTCILALDRIFVPYCFLLNSISLTGKLSFYHLIQVLLAIFENSVDCSVLMPFIRKLIKAKIFNHIWNVKIDGSLSLINDYEDSSSACCECLSYLLNCFIKENENLETEMSFIKNSLAQLNCSLDECSSVLSQKCAYLNHMTNSVDLYSIQVTFLYLCYVSYLNNTHIMNSKRLIPHLIYYATCNSETINTTSIIMKMSAIMWDMLSKITSPVKVYTHHEALLWWCFRNPQFNSYSSFVLQTWMKFCLSYDDDLELHSTFKLLLKLLTTIDVAQETFLRQFESNSEISFYFLKSICDSEVYKNENSNVKEKMKSLILALVQYIKNYLVRILAIKNHIEEKSEDNFLSIGLECILWCYGQIHVNPQIDMKFIFHVTNFCSSSDFENEIILIHCLKFLHFAVTKDERDSQAWFIITGNTRFISFLQNCLAMHQQFVNEVLILLVAIVNHQTVGRLKSSSYVKVSLKQFCKWLNNSRTKFMSFDLLNCLLDVEFDGTFLRINSIEQNISLLTRNDLRILVFYVQNAMILGDPALEKIIFMTFRKLLYYISKTDSSLENHIMLQPWVKLVLESRLEDIYASWDLFEKWFTYKTENITLDEIMQRFADEILTKPQELIKSKHSIIKLYSGVYKKCLSKETKVALKEIMDAQSKSNIKEKEENNLVCEVENLVTSYISHNSVVINS